MGKDKAEEKGEDPFGEEGLFDDKCEVCCSRCCCAPPPFRVALLPVIFLLAVFIVVWALFFYDVTGMCKADKNRPPPCVPTNVTDPVLNVTKLVACPDDAHTCDYLLVTNVPVAIWGLFLFVITLGYAILRAIVSILWWIFRALSGKNGMIWAYIKPIDWAVFLIVWNFLFFICYNRWLFSATPLVYTVCRAVSVVLIIVCITYIFASLLATLAARTMSAKARERAQHFRQKAKLVDKAIGDKDASVLNTFTFGLSTIAKKSAKNTAKTAKAAKDGEDVVIEMEDLADKKIAETYLKKAFERIDKAKKGFVNKDQMADAAGVKAHQAKELWKLFSPEPEGVIYYPEFQAGVREVERGVRDTVNELQSRDFITKIIRLVIMILLFTLGFTIAMHAIDLQISVLVQAISLLMVAITLSISGLFGRILNAFVFLLYSHPYYKGDLAVLGGDIIRVRKISLLNTYGVTADNKWVMYDNAGIAATRILNLSRSSDCIFVYETTLHVDTPKKTIDTWERTIKAFIASKPEHWRQLDFAITAVNATNQYTVTMSAYVRGANWAHSEAFNPIRAELWKVVHQSAVQLGIYAAPKDAETETVTLVTEAKKDEKQVPLEKSEEFEESSSSSSDEKAKKSKSKKKEKESKKDK